MRSLGDPSELEEERRLAYVGSPVPRTACISPRPGAGCSSGGSNYNPPSRFLTEVPDGLMEKAGKRQRRSASERAAATGPRTTVDAAHRPRGSSPSRQVGPGHRPRVVGTEELAEAEVMFDTQGKKRLLLAWAPLEQQSSFVASSRRHHVGAYTCESLPMQSRASAAAVASRCRPLSEGSHTGGASCEWAETRCSGSSRRSGTSWAWPKVTEVEVTVVRDEVERVVEVPVELATLLEANPWCP